MLTNFRKHHLLSLLSSFDLKSKQPLDFALSDYLRNHKQIGSHDRKIISDTLYGVIRFKETLDAFLKPPISWEARVDLFTEIAIEKLVLDKRLEPHQKVSFPKPLYHYIISTLGAEKGEHFCRATNYPAPTTIRVNLLKITRDALYAKWKPLYEVSLCTRSETGIIFHKKINFHALSEYREGLFEIQDEASQLISDLVEVREKDEVLDFCAGAGGKALAIGARMRNKGQIFLHDIRKEALLSAKKRLKRAGMENGQFLHEATAKLSLLKGRMNWILLDVPCSGSGTWRRNPDQKYRFLPSDLASLKEKQRAIFAKALPCLSPKGKIVYATCSIFPEENEEQIDYFTSTYSLKVEKPYFQSMPEMGQMDGFFGAVLSPK